MNDEMVVIRPREGVNARDRSGWRYRSRRRGRVWRITGVTPFGWQLWPDWPGALIGTAGGVKPLFRSVQELDDARKWERVQ